MQGCCAGLTGRHSKYPSRTRPSPRLSPVPATWRRPTQDMVLNGLLKHQLVELPVVSGADMHEDDMPNRKLLFVSHFECYDGELEVSGGGGVMVRACSAVAGAAATAVVPLAPAAAMAIALAAAAAAAAVLACGVRRCMHTQ